MKSTGRIVATRELRILGSDKEDSDWQELYENAEMEYKSGIEIMLEQAGPFEYLKVEGVKGKESRKGRYMLVNSVNIRQFLL